MEPSWKQGLLRELRQAEPVPLVGHLEPSGDLFWEPSWDQIGPRGAKMGPKEPPRASTNSSSDIDSGTFREKVTPIFFLETY